MTRTSYIIHNIVCLRIKYHVLHFSYISDRHTIVQGFISNTDINFRFLSLQLKVFGLWEET